MVEDWWKYPAQDNDPNWRKPKLVPDPKDIHTVEADPTALERLIKEVNDG